ncbi:purine-cytosine permease family protein [Chromobacterium haemolyticum]|uniref:purine-cytosine permease family protein n=1 Tax=Chromobacterium haemolyticum TaxID=394935 RepID=UPI001318A168|nr:cytosine permease [Chromobacterium haemolyticum]MDH0340458.1 cytosine permease [Chromobacterium haemolyticum]BBH14938.1 transporter membrane subunit [Chromobacterium haemolyticum]
MQQDHKRERRAQRWLETRSIDYVPAEERRGKAWQQAPFWFAGNFVLTTMMVGFAGPLLGLGVGWSILAIALGVGLGTMLMACHANQGPRLGLPQMIQSRAQFGRRGAILPFMAAFFVYIGFNVFDVILATDAIAVVFEAPRPASYAVLIAAAGIVSIVGHDLLHVVQRWLTCLLILIFSALSIALCVRLAAGGGVAMGVFAWPAWLAQMSAAAGYQLSYSVYVSDYSRYLPEETPAARLIAWTWLGAAGSALWLMSLGAVLAGELGQPDAIQGLRQLGEALAPGVGALAVLIAAPALVGIMAVNFYGAMLTGLSALDAMRPVPRGLIFRVSGITVSAVVVWLSALGLSADYLASFNVFVSLMLYLLVPWSAVNLVDFYWVRRGRYAIRDICLADGVYGQWSRPGLLSYLGGLLAMLPFVVLGAYAGPAARALGGVDLSWVVGLLVSGCAYWVLSRQEAAQAAWER